MTKNKVCLNCRHAILSDDQYCFYCGFPQNCFKNMKLEFGQDGLVFRQNGKDKFIFDNGENMFAYFDQNGLKHRVSSHFLKKSQPIRTDQPN